jgi:broad specificity phosphatase PhoE
MARNLGINQNWSDKETRPFDTPLLEPKGIELAKNTAISIKNRGIIIDKIICSPLRRCIQTAVEVAKVFKITEIKIDNRVMEDGQIVGNKLNEINRENKKNGKPLLKFEMTLISDAEIKTIGGDIKFIKPSVNSKESIIPKLDEDGEGFRKRLYTVIDEEITSDNSNPNSNRTIIIGHGGSIGFMADRIKNNMGGMHVITEMDKRLNLRSANQVDNSISCQMFPLDEVDEIDNFDIILVDIEGMDARFLKGAENKILKNKPIIIIEIWDNNKRKFENMLISREGVIKHIIDLGYTLHKNIDDDFIFIPK